MTPSERPRTTARSVLAFALKLGLTLLAFRLLLTHPIAAADGESVPAWRAIREYLPTIDATRLWRFTLAALAIKLCGIAASMTRWALLLRGQGIVFAPGHIVTTFFIGRFLGTFLPSTIGLDGYKLYDAARFSGRTAEAAAATLVEKIVGFVGILLTFFVALPFGRTLLGEHAGPILVAALPIALVLAAVLFTLALRPTLFLPVVTVLPARHQARARAGLQRLDDATGVYRGQASLLAGAIGLSFFVHFCTATMYYFTALAVGAAQAQFWEVVMASTIQIFATVLAPFTLAGEGVREIVHAMLLAHRIGTTQSILSASLGFWAAEAPTLIGGVFYMLRSADYQPRVRFIATTR